MQRYVLRHSEYAAVNLHQTMYQRAYEGHRSAEDFCMVNYPTCRIELKAFYMLKTMDGDTRYTHENLLGFGDFTDYLPLF